MLKSYQLLLERLRPMIYQNVFFVIFKRIWHNFIEFIPIPIITFIIIFIITYFLSVLTLPLHSHSGRTDKSGCHYPKNSKIQHCHDGSYNRGKIESSLSSSKYHRKDWKHWIDRDHDCQNERQELLISDSLEPVRFYSRKKCRVLSGKWVGAFSGKTFTRSDQVDIDHLVPLKEAHLSGGRLWNKKKRTAFANDRENLLVVSRKINRQKGAKDIAQWLPKEEFRCDYLKKWVTVKTKYQLKIDRDEQKVIEKYRTDCEIPAVSD